MNVSPRGVRGFGLDRPGEGDLLDAAALRRSSVALRRASRASSSEVWEETAFFLCGTDPGLALQGINEGLRVEENHTFRKQQHLNLRCCCRF